MGSNPGIVAHYGGVSWDRLSGPASQHGDVNSGHRRVATSDYRVC